jgi:hypothetical protein
MSDFWGLSDGGTAKDTGTEYEIPGGNMEPIPDDSSVLAMIDEAKWADKEYARYISLRWSVISPVEFKNRKIFQKLWVTSDDPMAKDADRAAKKRDKARRMLAVIDANAGGKLVKLAGMPDDDDLTANLAMKPMVIKIKVWSMPDREQPGAVISGNWICAVSPKTAGIDVKAAKPVTAKAGGHKPNAGSALGDDEIPF